MANLFEHKERRVVPNWRSFGKTVVMGELNSFQKESNETKHAISIDEYLIDWKLNRTIIHAADLLGASIVNNCTEDSAILDAAKFIIDNSDKATFSQRSLAKSIIEIPTIKDFSVEFAQYSTETLSGLVNTNLIYSKIREIKELINKYPYNSIQYVELSRYYSILGQEEQAIKSIKIAIFLAPNNRFVLRSATRLFAHYHTENNRYLNYMHSLLINNPMTGYDPWLTSAEISVATILKRTSKFITKGINLINSNNISAFNFTELASSIGTVELLHGTRKKSKEYFTKALINPNDNSLAQIEWASSKDSQLNIDPSGFDVKMNYEALALDNYHNHNFSQAVENSVKWFIDMPFSKRPIMFGANLASSLLDDHDKAISILNAGLISNPNDPQIINNLAYSLSLNNRTEEAFEQLNRIRNYNDLDDVSMVCLMATRGLACFRSNQPEIGRSLYLDAISETRSINYPQLNWIAILNYTREEILYGSDEYVEHLMGEVAKISLTDKDVELCKLKDEVVKLYQKLRTERSK